MRLALRAATLLAASLLGSHTLRAQSTPGAYIPSPANAAARTWYQDAKLGMFIHWGPSSILQDGEWVMNNRGIRAAEYESLVPLFNPVKFDASMWARTAKAAGMKYITLITKHHDGIALFDSKVSDYTVVKRSPFARDIVKELADACAMEGIRHFFYYSQLDWHHPDFYPRGETGRTAGRAESGSFPKYLDYMDAQLTELLTNYGPVGGIWFDGVWDQPKTDWRLAQTYALIHRLQPATLIIPNNHEAPRPGEDVQTFERDQPGANAQGFNTTTIGALPLEMSETMNDSWGFRLTDRNWKSSSTLIRSMVEAAGRNTNFLLNVGPRPDGTFPDSALAKLSDIGAWMRVNGTSIYGTRGGPLTPRPWGVTTQRGDTVFVHLMHGADPVVALPAFPRKVQRAYLLDGGASVAVAASASALVLTLPQRAVDSPDQVIVLVPAK
ncbi:MAG: alpha-L-fucosidase [Gemmatimonadaceae bacterium]|nr:alpha-L-fucosidase [Gemmatimonadaceae bacterium]